MTYTILSSWSAMHDACMESARCHDAGIDDEQVSFLNELMDGIDDRHGRVP
jgi:hypothetical protein